MPLARRLPATPDPMAVRDCSTCALCRAYDDTAFCCTAEGIGEPESAVQRWRDLGAHLGSDGWPVKAARVACPAWVDGAGESA